MNALDGAAAAYSEGGLADLAASYEEGEVVGEKGAGEGVGGGKDVAMEVDADLPPPRRGAGEKPLDSEASSGDADAGAAGGDGASTSEKPGAGDPKSVAGKRDGQQVEKEEKKTETAQKELGLLGDVRAVSHQSLEKQLIGKAEAAAARAEEAEREAAKAMKVRLPTPPPQPAAVSWLSRTHPPTA
jgi:hypothetical protein